MGLVIGPKITGGGFAGLVGRVLGLVDVGVNGLKVGWPVF